MSEGGVSFNKTPGSGGGDGAGGAGGGGDKPEFELIRSAAPPPAGGPPVGLIALIVVVALAGGGYFLFGGGGGGDSSGEASKTEALTTTEVKDVDVPQAILDQIDIRAESDLHAGLDLAQERLAEYPCQEIRDRIARFRKELGMGVAPGELLNQAEALAKKEQWAEAILKTDQVLSNEGDNSDEINARAYYLRGACKGYSGERAAGIEDLRSALEIEFEPKETAKRLKAAAEKLIKQWSS